MSLYTFDSDTGGTSTCYDDCAANWPPVTTTGMVHGDAGVTGTIDATQRTDGTSQVRYNGDPLYYFAGDSAPGDTNGDGVGGVWHLAGQVAGASPSAATGGSSPSVPPAGGGCDPTSDPYCY